MINQVNFVDDEQLQKALAILKANNVKVKLVNNNNQYGKLIVNNDIATCKYCKTEFSIKDLTAEELEKAKKTGICKHCLQKLDEVSKIEKAMKKSNSAGSRVRNIIESIQNQFTPEMMKNFQDREYCHDMFGILYPLYLDVTNKTKDEISVLRKYNSNYNRFGVKPYEINNRSYIMCNDLYERHILKFTRAFVELGLLDQSELDKFPDSEEKFEFVDMNTIENIPKKRKTKAKKETFEIFDFNSI